MLNIALTGNIAAGKSTVVELFRRWGATIIDADELAREAQAPGTEVLTAIAQRFGADVLAADGSLDRGALRSKVMGDDAALSALNAIVHPAVRRRRDELVEAARRRGDALVVNVIPLLFEVLDPAQFDVVVLVDAPVPLRRTRLRTMRGLTVEDADRMIAAQMDAERKRARSDLVIENEGTMKQLEARARAAFTELRRRAAERQLAGRKGPLLFVVADAQDEVEALRALAACGAEAGLASARVAGKTPTIAKAIRETAPGTIVATTGAAKAARAAWRRAGHPGALVLLGPGDDFDLRPWGGARVGLRDNPLP